MLRQAFVLNHVSVYVNVNVRKKGSRRSISVALDFFVDDLFFMFLDGELWAVECLGGGKCLIFNGSELIRIDS
jgi:hypothetical protein